MTSSIVSIRTRIKFREYFVNSTLRVIHDAFKAYEVLCDSSYQPEGISGERRILVEQYYHTVNWSNRISVRKILKVYENVILDLTAQPLGFYCNITYENNCNIAGELMTQLKRDGIEWINNKLIEPISPSTFNDLMCFPDKLDGAHIQLQILRMKESVETDPSLVIGTAKELIETTCKTILEERGIPITGALDIPTLTKMLLKELSLVPEGVEDNKRGSDLIKAILRSLGTIGNDLSQLRGLYGTGHGKPAKTQALQSRHAKLAAGAAATLVTFLFETHVEKLNTTTEIS